jgi:hypothetical protein
VERAQASVLADAIGHGMHDIYRIALLLALVVLALAAGLPAALSPTRGAVGAEAREAD